MLRGGLVGRAATKHEAIRSPPSGFGRQPRSCLRAAPGNHRRVPVGSPPPPQSLSRGKKWLFRSALVLLPIFACLTAEIGLRMGGYGFDPHFFKHATIGGTDFIVQNEDFTLRFFPKEMVRNPGPLRFPAHKAPGTFRIFIFGESAAMGDPAESLAPDRYLGALLRAKFPNRNFEIINTGITAVDSHVILPIARECTRYDGDLWIIYMGNNEMVGPFGAATVFGRQAPPLAYARLATACQRFRLGQWLAATARHLAGSQNSRPAWGGMEMFQNNQIPPESPKRETVYRNFQRNLDDIIRAGCQSGAKVLVNGMAVNLKDCPPFASLSAARLSATERAQFEQCFRQGLAAEEHQDFASAIGFFAQAAQSDQRRADLQFHWGRCLLAISNAAAAHEHFQLACDNDALPFRADSRINAAIQQEVAKVHAPNLLFLDAAAVLAAGSPEGICGNETFFEHVHFDFDARYRLARAWAGKIESLLPVTTNGWIARSPWAAAWWLRLLTLPAIRNLPATAATPACPRVVASVSPWAAY